ncbi:MAG: DUF2927 domain-containing protein [Geminicoccaceae bacterium]
MVADNETSSYTPRPAQSSAFLQIPDDLSIIESDERTQSCMADMACMREIFLMWTLGNDHEERPAEYEGLGIFKAEGPMVVKVVGDATSEEGNDGILRGLMDTIAVLRSAGMQITTTSIERPRNSEPLGPANVIVFVSDDFYRDQHGRFARVLEEDFHDGHQDYEKMLIRQHRPRAVCTLRLFADGNMIVVSAAIMIPGDLPRGEMRLCFYEEIIQALGPANDFREPLLSTFTDNENVPWFSDFDYLLTRLFFHPMVKPGMSRDEIIGIFPRLYQIVTTSTPFCLSFDDCLEEFL